MKSAPAFVLAFAAGLLAQGNALQPVARGQVSFDTGFWAEKLATNRKVTIPHCFQLCEETKRIQNFAVAGGLAKGQHEGFFFRSSRGRTAALRSVPMKCRTSWRSGNRWECAPKRVAVAPRWSSPMSNAPRSPSRKSEQGGRDGKAELARTDAVFAALAHASRRQVLLTLHLRGGTMSAGEIADRFACT